jgi:lipopolysaccharide export system protein LptA
MMARRPSFCRKVLSVVAAGVFVVIANGAQAQAPRTASPPPAAAGKTAPAGKTTAQGVPNALQGFSQNREQPVQIDAERLEVREKDKVATFSGKVHVIQGDTDMRSQSMLVFYEEEAKGKDSGTKKTAKAAQPGPGGSSQIKRIEAYGDVVVTQKDQTATGDKAIFDMRANTVSLAGNVVISQCQNIVRGDLLAVDLTSGVSHVEKSREGGRVQALIQRGSNSENCKDAAKTPAQN